MVGYYTDPVVTLDFGSLYPSCMCEQNICKSTQITRQYALDNGVAFLQPPAPSVSGIWLCNGKRVARIEESSDTDIKVHYYDTRDDFTSRYTSELNEAISSPLGDVVLDDGGYALAWPGGERWVRRDADVLCFVDTPVFEGVIPLLERTLKLDREAAKKRMAEASEQGNHILVSFFDNLQNSVKVLMNALYGGLGSGKGGIFPDSSPLASAITARGRSLIVLVKKTLETRFRLRGTEMVCLDDADEAEAAGGKPLKVLYGDSVLGNTPVLVKVNNIISVKTIESLSSLWEDYGGFKSGEAGLTDKQQSVLTDMEAWTSTGWAPIKRVIRHHCNKRIYRILTHTGLVDVTEDHSLLSPDGELLKPADMVVGSLLMHGYPSQLLCVPDTISVAQAFIYGMFVGDGTCGSYYTPRSSWKHNWNICNLDLKLLNKCKGYLEVIHPEYDFKIHDVVQSSGAYHLVPFARGAYGAIRTLVEHYREQCYDGQSKKVPACIFSSMSVMEAFMDGLWAADGARKENERINCHYIDTKNQISAASYFMLLKAMNFNVSINSRSDKPNVFRLTWSTSTPRKNVLAVKKAFVLHESYNDYVYDLETHTGNFQAGIGQLIVKNTDSVMILMPGCSLQEAAAHGKAMSAYFGEYKLKPPHVLAFEKVLWPVAFYKKKMYAAAKYEHYGPDAKPKIWARGLSAVRRDNAVLVKDTVLAVMDMLFKYRRSRADIVAWVGQRMADVHNSAVLAHSPDAAFSGAQRFALADFIQSAGISKELSEFDTPNAAVAVALQMLEENQHSEVGKNSRVTFIVTKGERDAKRAEQATLPSRCAANKVALDPAFYTDSVVKKVAPMLSVLFAADERQGRMTRDLHGQIVELPPAKASDRDKLLGQTTAEAKIAGAFRSNTRLTHAPSTVAALYAPPERVAKKRAPAADAARAADPKQSKLGFMPLEGSTGPRAATAEESRRREETSAEQWRRWEAAGWPD